MLFSFIGNLALFVNLFLILKFFYRSEENLVAGLKLVKINFALVTISFFTLILAFILNENHLKLVSLHSHPIVPLIYKISGSWANHEGSMLLWCWVISLYNLISYRKIRKINFLISQLIILAITILYLVLASNPFELNERPDLAFGLNPILQDPFLAIHPPILYSGYAGFSVIFSYSLSILLKGFSTKKDWLIIQYWANIAWGFLSLGIIIGSYWAYNELGWGGFWFWDPVENSSLIPWFIALSLIHSNIITIKNQKLASWTIYLSLICFISCLFSSFLVRSGILSSVHSFAYDPQRGVFIIIYIGFLILYSAMILKKHQKQFLITSSDPPKFYSQEQVILINNVFLLTSAITIGFGTVFPLIYEFFTDKSVNVAAPYYNKTILPLLILASFFVGFIPNFIKNKQQNSSIIYCLIFSSIIISIFAYLEKLSIIEFFCLWVGGFLLFRLTIEFYQKLRNNSLNLYFLKNFTGHFSLAVLFISISLNSHFSQDINLDLKLKSNIEFANLNLKLTEISYDQSQNYFAKKAKFILYQKNSKDEIAHLFPEIRSYPIEKNQVAEMAVYHHLFYDLLVIIGQVPDDDRQIKTTIYYRPLMLFIWLGGGLVVLSSVFVYLYLRRLENQQNE